MRLNRKSATAAYENKAARQVLRPQLCFQKVLVRLRLSDLCCASSPDTLGACEALAASAGAPPAAGRENGTSSKAYSQTHQDLWHPVHNECQLPLSRNARQLYILLAFVAMGRDCKVCIGPTARAVFSRAQGDCFNQIRKLCSLVRIAFPTQKWLPWLGSGRSGLQQSCFMDAAWVRISGAGHPPRVGWL